MYVSSLEMWFIVSITMSVILYMISFLFKFNEFSVNSNEPFECGMESMVHNRMPFFMHFYLVAILFLIFDIEFVVTIPMVMMSMNFKQWSVMIYFIIIILILGLFMEMNMGTLDWKE